MGAIYQKTITAARLISLEVNGRKIIAGAIFSFPKAQVVA